MNHNNFSFKSENLHVDWISFRFLNFDEITERKMTSYLFQLQFNSYQTSRKLAKAPKEGIQVKESHKFEVILVKEISYWKGTIVNFSGPNASYFYDLIQKNLIDWSIFSGGVLNRFDLYYSRKNQKDKLSPQDFLIHCQNYLIETKKKVSFEKNNRGGILKIGNRRSNLYSRIYEEKNSLKLEHEMKGKFIQNYHTLLVSNQLEELERKMASHFLVYFGKLLPLECSYLDWLVRKLRPIRKQIHFPLALNSDYVNSEITVDPKDFILLLQFLTYAKNLDFEIEYFRGIAYREVIFELRNFLTFLTFIVQL